MYSMPGSHPGLPGIFISYSGNWLLLQIVTDEKIPREMSY